MKLKAGDLCLIYGLVKNTEKNGKCCTLVNIVNYGDRVRGHLYQNESGWVASGNFSTLIEMDGKPAFALDGTAIFSEKNLMKISGHKEPSTIKKEEGIEA